MTAALEHYTATLAETLLTDERAQALLGESEVRSMLLWHALEESEHKAVAFDVFRAAGGTETMRIWTMQLVTFSFLADVTLHTILSMLADRATYHPRVLLAQHPRAAALAVPRPGDGAPSGRTTSAASTRTTTTTPSCSNGGAPSCSARGHARRDT